MGNRARQDSSTDKALPSSPDGGASSDELKGIRLFSAIDADTLATWRRELVVEMFAAGEVVVREGETKGEMYVVLEGEMEVLKKSKSGFDARVALLGPGDWFGEMSILDVQPRSATVRTVAPSRLLKLSAADFDLLYRMDLRAYALLVMNIAREMSRRLRVADGILADLVASVVTTCWTQAPKPQ